MCNHLRSSIGVAVACVFYASFAQAGVGGVSFNLIVSPGLSNGLFATVGARTTQPGKTSWPVTIDVSALGTLPATLLLNLPDRDPVTLTRGRYENRGMSAFLWTGTGGDCSVVLNRAPQAFGGVLSCFDANYGISGDPDNLELDRYDPNPLGPPAGTEEVFTPITSDELDAIETADVQPFGPKQQDDVIDILVLYQESVRAILDPSGGRTHTYLLAQQCVDNLQHAIDDSLATARVHLVGVSRVSRTATGSVNLDLQYLRSDPEPLHLRDFWAADVVMYLTSYGGTAYGTSTIPGSSQTGFPPVPPPGEQYASLAQAVVQYNTALNDTTGGQPQEPYVFLHEFAHIIGANHNHENANNASPLEVGAYGRWAVNASKGSLRTILSNPTQVCLQRGTCTRIRYYSNPNVTVDWFTTGQNNYADNAKLIRDYWSHVPGYRDSVGRIFYDGFEP
jgi:hypothetical protein